MLGHQELDELTHKSHERPAPDAQVERLVELDQVDKPLSPCAHEVLALMELTTGWVKSSTMLNGKIHWCG